MTPYITWLGRLLKLRAFFHAISDPHCNAPGCCHRLHCRLQRLHSRCDVSYRIIRQYEIWPLLFWMVQLVLEPIFQMDCESGHRISLFCLGHVLWMRRMLGDLLWFVSFNLCLDSNFEVNLYLNREIKISYCSSWYG